MHAELAYIARETQRLEALESAARARRYRPTTSERRPRIHLALPRPVRRRLRLAAA